MSNQLIARTSITLALWALVLGTDGQRSVASAQALDVKPGSCPNSFNRASQGVLPVAILGSAAFDASQIDVSSVVLARADGVGGTVAPLSGPPGPGASLEDVGTPFAGTLCDCHELGSDGVTDLSLKFGTQDIVSTLQLDTVDPGASVELVVRGNLQDGTTFEVHDCIRLVPPSNPRG